MPNLSNSNVAQVVSTSKDGNVITIKNKALLREQVQKTCSSGTVANLGDRIQLNIEFSDNDHRYINEMYLRFKMKNKHATGQFSYMSSIIGFIDEMRLTINDKNVYLNQFGLAYTQFWSNYTNYGGNSFRQFWAENCSTMGGFDIDANPSQRPDTVLAADIKQYERTLLAGQETGYYYLPLSKLTKLFTRMPVSHIHKLSIQIQLANPPEGSMYQARTCGVPNNQTIALKDILVFTELELEARFDKYKTSIMNPKGFQTVHDNYHERQLYTITQPQQVIEVRLQQDFSPMENIKKLYLFTRSVNPTTGGTNPMSDLDTSYLSHPSGRIARIELRRNGQRILDLNSKGLIEQHMVDYYTERFRHKEWSPFGWGPEVDQLQTGYFLDLSRGSIPHNNDKHQMIKSLNGLKNFSQRYGEFTIRIYPEPGGWLPEEQEFVVIAEATKLFHVGASDTGFRFSEEY